MPQPSTVTKSLAAVQTQSIRRPRSRRMRIGLLVILIAAVELAAVWVLFSERGETEAARSQSASTAGVVEGRTGATLEEVARPTDEVDLGEYRVTCYQPAANTTLFITFHLFGTIDRQNSSEFARLLRQHKHRLRDNVIVIVRGAALDDLTDAGLGLLKRRILETSNATLGQPLLQGVVFSQFSCVEQ